MTGQRAGWIGTVGQVLHYLRTVRADQDPDGSFRLFGEPDNGPATFMGTTGPDAEIVVPGSVEYVIGGRRCNLAAGLRSTSYGLGVTVI